MAEAWNLNLKQVRCACADYILAQIKIIAICLSMAEVRKKQNIHPKSSNHHFCLRHIKSDFNFLNLHTLDFYEYQYYLSGRCCQSL